MSTPPKATPTTPQWAEEMLAACIPGGDVCDPQMVADHLRDWLAKHAPPPAAQPSDAAGLREAIKDAVIATHPHNQCGGTWGMKRALKFADDVNKITDCILTALAPYLKGEPGDSELLKECRELRVMLYATSTGMRGYHDDGELQDNREHPFIDFKRDSVEEIRRKNLERNMRHLSAQRGERGAE